MAWHSSLAVLLCGAAVSATPYPFERVLQRTSSMMSGNDVQILQALLARPGAGISKTTKPLVQDGYFGDATADAVRAFRKAKGLADGAVFDEIAAESLLDCCLHDGYRDDGKTAADYGKLYKVHVPIHKNRSIETWGHLYAANGTELVKFRAHTKGQGTKNDLTNSGDTPTGLIMFDFNTPEDDPVDFGPYPINRAVWAIGVEGVQTNAEIVMGINNPTKQIRSGILLHTGEFAKWSGHSDWKEPMEMPDSHGCIHSWPEHIKAIADALQSIGVVAHENVGGKHPYPYEPQGILSVEIIDDESTANILV